MTETGSLLAQQLSLHILVLSCQAGDERAFARLMDMFRNKTLALLRGLVGDDADDVQQEVWLAVYRGIGSLANPGAFRTWLYRTTRHRAIDFLRKRRRERELLQDVAQDVLHVNDETTDAFEETNDASLRRVEATTLEAALRRMPPLQREVILLRHCEDLSYQEIALVVGCPVGTVKTRLHHARRRLQEFLTRGQS